MITSLLLEHFHILHQSIHFLRSHTCKWLPPSMAWCTRVYRLMNTFQASHLDSRAIFHHWLWRILPWWRLTFLGRRSRVPTMIDWEAWTSCDGLGLLSVCVLILVLVNDTPCWLHSALPLLGSIHSLVSLVPARSIFVSAAQNEIHQ